MYHILIIDDDSHINEMLNELLKNEGYNVSSAYSGTEARMLLNTESYDLILLDLMLPGLTGEELLPLIKDTPVIVVSAKADVTDKVNLLLSGAVDYITKPFDVAELLARIAVHLRTARNTFEKTILNFREITLNTTTPSVVINGADIKLTRTEYAILKLLMQNSEQVVAKLTILDRISDDTPDCTEDSLKIHIHNLRHKLKGVIGRDYITAVWGIGFMLTEKS